MFFRHIDGLISAPFTALQSDGSLNLPMVQMQVEGLKRDGVLGAFICGTTGEGLSLTTEERKQLAAAWVEASGENFLVIVHVGHPSLDTARDLADHAQHIGAAGVAAMPASPFYTGTSTEIAAMCQFIAGGAPELPFFYYHIPSFSGVNISVYNLLVQIGNTIPNFQGVKFTHTDLMDYARCLRLDGGRFDLLFGRDEMLLSALVLGGKGAVGSTYNYLAPLYRRLLASLEAGDLLQAREHQAEAQEIIAAFSGFPGLPAQKALMRLLGQDLGPVRPPLKDLSDNDLKELELIIKLNDYALKVHRFGSD